MVVWYIVTDKETMIWKVSYLKQGGLPSIFWKGGPAGDEKMDLILSKVL